MNVQVQQMPPVSECQTKPSVAEFVSEASDLASGAGIILFVLAPFALPALALLVVVALALIIPPLLGAALAAPILLARRWSRSRARAITAAERADDHRGARGIERRHQVRHGLRQHTGLT